MVQPSVHIRREPLSHMLLAGAEIYNRECYGILFGTRPNKRRNKYHITGIQVVQGVIRRTNTEISGSTRCEERMFTFLEKAGSVYSKKIGDFHSHPAFGKYRRPFRLSDGDIENFRDLEREWGLCLALIINIRPCNGRTVAWRRLDHRTRLHGSLGGFIFDLRVYRLIDTDKDPKRQPEALVIEISPTMRKALNRNRNRSA